MAHMNCKEHAPNYVKCISELQSTFNHLRADDVYIRACKLLPQRRMTYIYARKHFFLKSILSGTLRARHRENRPQVVNERFHDFHLLEHNIIFVMQPFSVEVKDAPTDLQMILIDLQYNKFVRKKVDKILIRNLVRILLQICTF